MTHVVNLYGGPGSGKSTSAARLFALLKQSGITTELVQEYVKSWAWENRKPVTYDQFYFFGKQSRKEYSLFGKVDVLVTDSPLALCAYYAKVFGTPETADLFEAMVKHYFVMCKESGVTHSHYFLNRTKAYDPKGRFQTEEEARKMDADQRIYLAKIGLAFTTSINETDIPALAEFIVGANSAPAFSPDPESGSVL